MNAHRLIICRKGSLVPEVGVPRGVDDSLEPPPPGSKIFIPQNKRNIQVVYIADTLIRRKQVPRNSEASTRPPPINTYYKIDRHLTHDDKDEQ